MKNVFEKLGYKPQINPFDWLPYQKKTVKNGILHSCEKYMDPPVCNTSEFYFTLFLFKQCQLFLKTQQKSESIPVQVHSSNSKKKIDAFAIRKLPIKTPSQFHFGSPNYLVITGPLAGMICIKSDSKKKTSANVSPVKALRLFNTENKIIYSPLKFFSGVSYSQHNLQLYEEVKIMIDSHGLLNTIIFLLQAQYITEDTDKEFLKKNLQLTKMSAHVNPI